MKVATKVEKKVYSMQDGITFKYKQLGINAVEYGAAAKAIERLVSKGVIKRLSTGVFYKPKNTPFGELLPRTEEILKTYLFVKDKRIAYVTGTALYNSMGLTTQVPNIIKVASRTKRITVDSGSIQVRSVKSYLDVTDNNYRMLEILDVLKDFTKIPDIDKKMAVTYLLDKLKNLSELDMQRILEYAVQYPPRTRAFLGALFGAGGDMPDTKILKDSLNPLTTYNMGISEDILFTVSDWNIM